MFALLAIASCKDDFTVDDIQESPKLVVYCMPSPGDTTKIQVSSSVPVTLKSLSKAIPQYVNNATIVYSVNGQQVPAVSLGNGIYQVVAPQKTGDNIRLEVSAEGFTTVSASTVIPDTVPIQKVRVSRISLYDSDYSGTRPYDQVKVTFATTAPPPTTMPWPSGEKYSRGTTVCGTMMVTPAEPQTLTL